MPRHLQLPVVGDPARQPVAEHARREDQEEARDERAPHEGGVAGLSELDRARPPCRPRPRAPELAACPRPELEREGDRGEPDERQREHRRGRPVEEAPVLEVDRPGERVVAHQRDDAEVGQDVERHEERAERDRRAYRGERHSRERAGACDTKAAGRLLERRVHVAKRGLRQEKDVRIGRERQCRDRAPVAGRVGQALDPERLLEQAALAEEAEQAEGRDVARDHERQRHRDGPGTAAGQVGAGDEPGGRDGDDDCRDDDAGDEQDGVYDEAERGLVPEDIERPPAAARDPDHEVHERQQEERDDGARAERECQGRTPDGARRHYVSQPVWRSSSTVDSSSAPNAVSSTSGPWIWSSGTRPAGGSIPATRGYSFSSASST